MARPQCPRWVGCEPGVTFFKPQGVPLRGLGVVRLGVDELEAMRLADLEGMYQEEAAERMKVSRATFGRIVESGRRKAADALVNGKALKIEGGEVRMNAHKTFQCSDCSHRWQVPYGAGRSGVCPACQSGNVHRVEEERGWASRGRGAGRGRCVRRVMVKGEGE